MSEHDLRDIDAVGEFRELFDYKLMDRLTPRQVEVLRYVCVGCTNKETSKILSISVSTVRRHIYMSCKKLGFYNRTQLIVAFVLWQYKQKAKELSALDKE